jgi:hypothetical protein
VFPLETENLWKISQDAHNPQVNRKQIAFRGLGIRHLIHDRARKRRMKSPHINKDIESLDHRSSRAICDAVGKGLQQVLRPELAGPSSHLQHLIDQLRRHDEADDPKSH